jgi:hypothetical protein
VGNYLLWAVIEVRKFEQERRIFSDSDQYVDICDIAFAFDQFPGFEGFSNIFTGLLQQQYIPWHPSMIDSVSFDQNRGPIGSSIDSSQLRILDRRILSIADNDIETDLSKERIVAAKDSTPTTLTWQVVKSLNELDSVLRDSKPGLKARDGGFALPRWMLHMDVSERSFSIILHHRSVEWNVSSDPLRFEWDFSAKGLAMQDFSAFAEFFGDSYVSGFSVQRTVSVVFNVILKNMGELERVNEAVRNSLATIQSAKTSPRDQIERGCRYLQDLHSCTGVEIRYTVLKSNWKTKEVQEVQKATDFVSLAGVAKDISAAAPIPTKIFRRPISELVKLAALEQQSSETDKPSSDMIYEAQQDGAVAKAEARANAVALRADLILDVATLVARSRTLPLQNEAPLTKDLHKGIETLITSLQNAESKLSGFGFPEEDHKAVLNNWNISQKLVHSRLAAAHLIRNGICKEKQL